MASDGLENPETDAHLDIDYVNEAKDAPTLFADGLIFATLLNGAVRLQFSEYVPQAANGPSPGLKSRTVATMVVPLEGYQSMMAYLNDINLGILVQAPSDGE